MQEGLRLTELCASMYTVNPSGLACDRVRLLRDGLKCTSDVYLLRPEVVESIFYAWRYTRDPKWRELTLKIWRAIKKHCETVNGAFTDVKFVSKQNPKKLNKQESWFLAETLKYIWLTLSDDSVLNLNKFVLNTEAHPLPKAWTVST